jgi:hypothetical protein
VRDELTKSTPETHQTVRWCTSASAGITRMAAASRMSTAIIRRLRSTRSTQAPMTSPKRRWGRAKAAVVIARLMAECVS